MPYYSLYILPPVLPSYFWCIQYRTSSSLVNPISITNHREEKQIFLGRPSYKSLVRYSRLCTDYPSLRLVAPNFRRKTRDSRPINRWRGDKGRSRAGRGTPKSAEIRTKVNIARSDFASSPRQFFPAIVDCGPIKHRTSPVWPDRDKINRQILDARTCNVISVTEAFLVQAIRIDCRNICTLIV